MKAGSCRYNIRIGYRHTSSRHPMLLHKPSIQAAPVTWRTHSTNLGSGLCTLSQCRPWHMLNTVYQNPMCVTSHVHITTHTPVALAPHIQQINALNRQVTWTHLVISLMAHTG